MPPPSDYRVSDRRAGSIVVAAFAVLTVLFTGQFPPFKNPNELSRIDAVYAVVENGTFSIDEALQVLGDHEDKAIAGGRFYSNKAPGLALAAIPVYRALRTFFPRPTSPFAPIFIWLRVLTVSSVCVLALARFRARIQGDGLPAPALVTAAIGFGTPYLFYSRSFFSHAWTAALLFLSWDLLRRCVDWRFRRRIGLLAVGAGFLAGWAAISEYPAAILVAVLALRAFARRNWRRGVLFALGAAIPVAVLLAYDAVCFGSPLVLSSAREALPDYAALAHRGVFGIGPPRLDAFRGYLFHPTRGILLFSPFFLFAAAGLWIWRRGKEDRPDASLALLATVLFFVVMCGYPNWHGAWSLGDRYLVPVLFFPALAIPRALERPGARFVFAAAAVYSIAMHWLVTASFPYFPLGVGWSPATASAWLVARGYAAPALLPGTLALAVAAAVTIAAVAAGLATARLPHGRTWLAIPAGLLPLLAILVLPPRPSYGHRLWRAAVLGKFSPYDPDRRELKAVVRSARAPGERRMAAETWKNYGGNDR
jgi:hypothetical protein